MLSALYAEGFRPVKLLSPCSPYAVTPPVITLSERRVLCSISDMHRHLLIEEKGLFNAQHSVCRLYSIIILRCLLNCMSKIKQYTIDILSF